MKIADNIVHDVVIIGGGPGASVAALHLLKLGITPLIVEKETFPRYHIGESLTGECGNCLRELELEHLMTRRAYPVKLGVTVWGTGGKNSFWVPVQKRNEHGDLQDATTWQVRRADFDHDLMEAAIQRGARHLKATAESVIRAEDGSVAGVMVRTEDGGKRELRARVVVDASGQSTFLANQGVTGPKERGSYCRQAAIFTQVKGALRDEGPAGGNTLIFYQKKHHWSWFIPLSDEATSIGIVIPSETWRASGEDTEAFLRKWLVEMNPELTRRMTDITFTEPVRTISNYSYRIDRFTGPGFLCIGDAHRFTDPIFSFGVFFAAQEAKQAACAIRDLFDGKTAGLENPFAEYERRSGLGQRIVQDLIDCFWDYPLAFQRMAHHTHTGQITDCFAGRIYQEDHEISDAVRGMRNLLARERKPELQAA